jgi:AP-1 complex subunit beta-1
MEKLEIIIRLASERNIEQVLLELKEYSTEVDVEFVRKSVRAIGRCAIKLERSAERCINVLLDLIKTKVNYVVQEAIVVIKDIFRKYPNKYESIIANLCENLEDLDEPEAKAAMVWIIGEYVERIENADDLLDSFLESFQEETAQVQLQLLTATVKLFLKQPDTTQEIIKKVLNLATEESDNPDLRDRGYFYWRLLSSDPEAARVVVLSDKPEIGEDNGGIEPVLLDELIGQIANLSSIYHKPPEAFIMKSLHLSALPEDEAEEGDEQPENEEMEPSQSSYQTNSNGKPSQTSTGNSSSLLDLLDDSGPSEPSTPSASTSAVNMAPLVNAETGHGISISGAIVKNNGRLTLELDVKNSTTTSVQALAIQFNKNAFAIVPQNPQIVLPQAISNGS